MNADEKKAAKELLVKANFAVHIGDADAALKSAETACELLRPHCLKPPSLFTETADAS